jgi:hypothetical protein
MGLNIAIGSTSGAVLILGILIRVYGVTNNLSSLVDFGTTLAVLGGIVIGFFVLMSMARNLRGFLRV